MKYLETKIVVSAAVGGILAMVLASTKPVKTALSKIEEKVG